MKFWDSSVIIPLLIEEQTTPLYAEQLKEDMEGMVAWWGSPIECVSAIARKVREGVLRPIIHAGCHSHNVVSLPPRLCERHSFKLIDGVALRA